MLNNKLGILLRDTLLTEYVCSYVKEYRTLKWMDVGKKKIKENEDGYIYIYHFQATASISSLAAL